MGSVEPDYRYNRDIYQYEQNHGNNTESNGLAAILFVCLSTLFCYSCNIFVDRLIDKYKRYKIETKLLLPINIKDIKENKCSICLEEYIENNDIIKLNCEHQYHKECIKEWLKINNNCPQCRKIII